MLFNSLHFVVFFPIAAIVYFSIPHRYRWAWLLACSYYFYMAWKPAYVLVIWLLTAIDYVAGRAIGAASTPSIRRLFLGMSLASNLTLLFAFKYFNFTSTTTAMLLGKLGVGYDPPFLDLVLPLGISFHTFQALSYTIDVYRGRQAPERHLGRFALFIAFFPQLVAGPIERAWHMLPQFLVRHDFDYENVTTGLQQMAWGFFKKLVIADRLAIYVNEVYDDPQRQTGLHALVATYFFAYQIYCDFSGYSDIAIGAARVLGFELTTNFARPYFADSIRDFWHRWHISLSTWFRDYLYIPLGGSRVGPWRRSLNLAVVFVVSGLWHGANWTFVVWGALHGAYMIVGFWSAPIRDRFARSLGLDRSPAVARVVRTVATFHLTLIAWVFFRAASLSDVATIFDCIVNHFGAGEGIAVRGFDVTEVWLSVGFVALMEIVHVLRERGLGRDALAQGPAWLRWSVYYAAVFVILFFGRFDEREFIYFQF
jgi:D-alanyl-lipoteichoic acid acyltransferase DltB (MBOAT superfamily)